MKIGKPSVQRCCHLIKHEESNVVMTQGQTKKQHKPWLGRGSYAQGHSRRVLTCFPLHEKKAGSLLIKHLPKCASFARTT